MQAVKNYFDFLWAMTEKEIKARYKRAVFGFLWVVLDPVLQMIIIGFIFSLFIKIPNYFLFLFTGLLPWRFFSMSLSKATTSIVHERLLLKKAEFPKETIPISIILSNFIHLLISYGLLFAYLIVKSRIVFPRVLILIPALAWLFIFTIGLSLLTATLQVRFRDINFFVQTTLILWFYATPVLYNLTLIPANFHIIFAFNPLTTIFELIHRAFLAQGVVTSQLLLINLAATLLIVGIGILVYRKQRRELIDWL